jgi:hypothetical protein
MSADWRSDAASANTRVELAARGLLPPALDVPGSVASTLAVVLFALGVAAIARMLYRAGFLG